jgi:myo-inositol-1-phosphate synthase
MQKIKVALVGVGNCASSLVQGVSYYSMKQESNIPGIMFPDIGGYKPWDIEFVAAWDVDCRKVGEQLRDAIFASPNCCRFFHWEIDDNCIVRKGPVLDGVAPHMLDYHENIHFELDDSPNDDLEEVKCILREREVDVVLNYLPVGSKLATDFWVRACVQARVPLVNCIPEFIASDPVYERMFVEAGIPIIGDDMRSQVGASVLSQVLQELAFDRGCHVKFHQQINVGGNTDFANMMDNKRIRSKKISKENVIRSQNDIRGIEAPKDSIYAGPSSFIPYLKDNKVAYIRMELEGFGGAPIEIDCKLSVQDSENSAGIVIDAIRYLKVAHEMGISGALRGPSAWTQKTPPQQMQYRDAMEECKALAERRYTECTINQVKK